MRASQTRHVGRRDGGDLVSASSTVRIPRIQAHARALSFALAADARCPGPLRNARAENMSEEGARTDFGKVVESVVQSIRSKLCAAQPRTPLSRCDAMPAREPASLSCHGSHPLTFG